MSTPFDPRQRQVIPRWRGFREALGAGELGPVGQANAPIAASDLELSESLSNWHTAISGGDHRLAMFLAAEVMAKSMILGEPERAAQVASHVLSRHDAPPLVEGVALRLVTYLSAPDKEVPRTAIASDIKLAHHRVRELRHRLSENPNNPIAWVELSRAATTAGLTDKALRAMTVALGRAAGNRYVLRSAARLFVHTSDLDRAYRVLEGAGAARNDPWLLASEIAVAHLARRSAKSMRAGRRVADDASYSLFERSELFSALATLEMSSGNDRRARKLFDASLRQPHENSLAQAAWASEKIATIHIPDALFRTPGSYEARAREAVAHGEWREAYTQSIHWKQDEPFSSTAAMHASHAAAIGLSDHESAIAVTEEALAANPNNAVLRNNLAYSLAHTGNVDRAVRELDLMRSLVDEPRVKVAYLATSGLVSYRGGDLAQGRGLYLSAVEIARMLPDAGHLLELVWVNFAHEEVYAGGDPRSAVVQEALAMAHKSQKPDVLVILSRVESLLGHGGRADSSS